MKRFYQISKRTKLIMTNGSAYYRSRIIEESYGQENTEICSVHKPMQIIDFNCKLYGSTLNGRKEVVRDILNSASKIPVPIIPHHGIYLIPTTSTKNKNCIWLSYHHIKKYDDYHNQTYVTFRDGTSTVINISYATFDKQYKRTSQVIVYFNRHSLFGEGPKLW